jgi:hypothetical protein
VDGFGRTGASTDLTVTRDQLLGNQAIAAGIGANFIGLRVEPANPLTATALLEQLGPDARALSRYDAGNGNYVSVARDGAGFQGVDFPLSGLDGFIVDSTGDTAAVVIGSQVVPQTVDLVAGLNFLTVPSPPAELTAFELLTLLGDASVASAVQRFDRAAGRFEAAVYRQGAPEGVDFPIRPGVAYQVFLHQPVVNFPLPTATEISIQISAPADGATVTASPLTVTGEVTGTEPLSVDVNGVPAVVAGGTFTADVPLAVGANVIGATVTDADLRQASDSVNVTFEPVDYAIAAGGFVTDSRIFTADPAAISQAAAYTETQIGVPAGITYTTTGVGLFADAVQVSFQIDVAPGTPPGIVEFQVEYGLLDADSNPLGPLSGNLFEFRIEITP